METYNTKIFYLRSKVLFPYCNLNVNLKKSEITRDIKPGDKILAFPVKNIWDFILYRNQIATLTEVQEKKENEGIISLTLKGLIRIKLKKIINYQRAEFAIIEEEAASGDDIIEELRKKAQELIFLINVDESDKLINLLNYIVNLHQMADFIANYFILQDNKRFKLYREADIHKRINQIIKYIERLISKVQKQKRSKDK